MRSVTLGSIVTLLAFSASGSASSQSLDSNSVAAEDSASVVMLTLELEKLEGENLRFEGDSNLVIRQENLKNQELIRSRLSAIKERRDLEEREKAKQKETERMAAEERAAMILDYDKAVKKIYDLQEKAALIEKDTHEQKQKAIQLASEAAPRGEFETQQEYDKRIADNPNQLKLIEKNFDSLLAGRKNAIEDSIAALRMQIYPAAKNSLKLTLGTYDIEQQFFPVSVSHDGKPMMNLCDTLPIRLPASREEAKALRTDENSLEGIGFVRMTETGEARLLSLTIKDSVLQKEFTTSLTYDPLREILPEDCEKMVLVKGGIFQMGSDSGEADERPAHSVTLSDFYIGNHEVTQRLWTRIMGSNPSKFSGCDSCPVENVSWNEIHKFLSILNQKTGKTFRIPCEAEWEYAARGGSLTKSYVFAGSNDVNEVAWYDGNATDRTHPVGEKLPNELGLLDMTGNVGEWCEDFYDGIYYSRSPAFDPKGPASGSAHVVRGGSWFFAVQTLRTTTRNRFLPDYKNGNFGFRLCLSKP